MMTLMTLEFLVSAVVLLALALAARKLHVYVWRGETDPFGRRCKNLGAIDHLEYQGLRAENPRTIFLQLDVMMCDREFTTISVLLKSPHATEREKRLGYYRSEGILFQSGLKGIVDEVVQPWEQQGYVPVAGTLSRAYT